MCTTHCDSFHIIHLPFCVCHAIACQSIALFVYAFESILAFGVRNIIYETLQLDVEVTGNSYYVM